MQRDHIALRQQRLEGHEFHARVALRRPVPGDHFHAAAAGDARHLGRDAAETDQPQRLAGQLHAVLAQPIAGAHLAVHRREPARRRPHQGDGAFGHRGVAIAFDQVNADAEFSEFLRVHVAARAGAEKHHMLQAGAAPRHVCRQRRVVDDDNLGAIEQSGHLLGCDVGIAVDRNRWIAGLVLPLEDIRQRSVGIDKNSAHRNLRLL